MPRSLVFAFLASLAVSASPALGQVRVATWNVAQLRGEEASVLAVIEELSLDDRYGPATPLTVIVMQEVQNADFQALLAGLGAQWSAATYTNSSEDNYGGAQACFYRADQLIEIPGGHADLYTGPGDAVIDGSFNSLATAIQSPSSICTPGTSRLEAAVPIKPNDLQAQNAFLRISQNFQLTLRRSSVATSTSTATTSQRMPH